MIAVGGSLPPKGSLLLERQSSNRGCRPIPVVASSRSIEAPSQKGVVITGGTKGFGYALASEFLSFGDNVVICGRDPDSLGASLAALQHAHPKAKVWGRRCDVSQAEDVAELAQYAGQQLGHVDLWLNNAGQVTCKRMLADVPAPELSSVVGANVMGSVLGSREAIRLMRQQAASPHPIYHIFNYGFTWWGAGLSKTAATHKATKTALTQLTTALRQELEEAGVTSIGVHNLSPGLVLTDLLLRDSTPLARRFFNALAEEPSTVAAALAPRIRGAQGKGSSIEYLSPATAFLKVATGVPQIVGGGRFFDARGDRVPREGEVYQPNGVRLPYLRD